MDKQMEEKGLKSVLKVSAALIVVLVVVVGALLVITSENDYNGSQIIEYNITMGDRYESEDGLREAPEGMQYAHVWIRHHNYTGEKLWVTPSYYSLYKGGEIYNQSLANEDSESRYEGYISDGYMTWYLVLFEVPSGSDAKYFGLKWDGYGSSSIKTATLDTIFSSDEDYVPGWNPIPEWPGVVTYSLELSDTFVGKDKWSEPASGMTYGILKYTIQNNNYSDWASNGISNNSNNFLLDLDGVLYSYTHETYDVPGYALVEVRPGHTYSGTVIIEVPRGCSVEDFELVWDGYPKGVQIIRL